MARSTSTPPNDADPLDWAALRDFLAVVEAGSLSAAARRLGLSQPTLTRRMAALEQRLRTELFRRTPRGLELTEAGEAVVAPARQMEQEARAIEVAITGRDQALAGTVRLSSTEGLAIEWLTPELADFQSRHPAIELQLLVRNDLVDLLRREADIAVRLGRPKQADLVARKLGELEYGLVASSAYLERMGRPRSPEDLATHRGVSFDESLLQRGPGAWLEQQLAATRIAYRSNSLQVQLAAVAAGLGIGGQVPFVALRRPGIERVLPELSIAIEVWLVTHAGLRRSARIRAVFDFLVERFEASREELARGGREPAS